MTVQGVTNSPSSFFQRNLSGIVATTALVTAVALGSLLALGLMHGNPLCLTSLAHKALVIGAPIGMGIGITLVAFKVLCSKTEEPLGTPPSPAAMKAASQKLNSKRKKQEIKSQLDLAPHKAALYGYNQRYTQTS